MTKEKRQTVLENLEKFSRLSGKAFAEMLYESDFGDYFENNIKDFRPKFTDDLKDIISAAKDLSADEIDEVFKTYDKIYDDFDHYYWNSPAYDEFYNNINYHGGIDQLAEDLNISAEDLKIIYIIEDLFGGEENFTEEDLQDELDKINNNKDDYNYFEGWIEDIFEDNFDEEMTDKLDEYKDLVNEILDKLSDLSNIKHNLEDLLSDLKIA